MSDYPKTYRFMKETANLRTNKLSKTKDKSKLKLFTEINPNPGFFAKRVGYRALVECDPRRRNAEIIKEDALRKKAFAKEEEAKQKTLAVRNANEEARTLEAIKRIYERADHSDQVFESLLFYVQLYGNPLPLDGTAQVFQKIASRTNLKPEYIKEILENQANPLTLSISRTDLSDSFCHVDLNRRYSGSFENLPRTKKILETVSLD